MVMRTFRGGKMAIKKYRGDLGSALHVALAATFELCVSRAGIERVVKRYAGGGVAESPERGA